MDLCYLNLSKCTLHCTHKGNSSHTFKNESLLSINLWLYHWDYTFLNWNLRTWNLETLSNFPPKHYIHLNMKANEPPSHCRRLLLGVTESLGSNKVNEFPNAFYIVSSITLSRATVLAFNLMEEFIALVCSWLPWSISLFSFLSECSQLLWLAKYITDCLISGKIRKA